MLCLKAESLAHDIYTSNGSVGVLPMNLSSSIRNYLYKGGGRGSSISNRPSSSSTSSGSSGLEDVKKTSNGREGRGKGGKMCRYRFQLEQDVQKLQKQLENEIDIHGALANAVRHATATLCNSPSQLPDKAQELLANIAVLEVTVSRLEEELVTLHFQLSQERNERRLAEYRLKHITSPPPSLLSYFPSYSRDLQCPRSCSRDKQEIKMGFPFLDRNVVSNKDSYMENLWHHPNHLSEEMVRCMRNIFLHLADSTAIFSKFSSECVPSPTSPHGHLSYSSIASFSDSFIVHSSMQSPSVELQNNCETLATRNTFDPYQVHGMVRRANIGSYSLATEVSWMSVGKKQLDYAAEALKRFRLLVEQLEKVDLTLMNCNERLAFWINLYNALIMHAYLAYGVPRSDFKLFSLMQKAAYTVGGHSFSAADIEYIILKMRPPAHRPQIALLLALHKFKISEEQKKYSIDSPEPLVAFALSCGMYSSPAVRIFTPENIKEELCYSLRDYIRASVGISKNGKLLVPKLLHCFTKSIVEDSLLPDWICRFLSPEQVVMIHGSTTQRKQRLLGARSSFGVIPFESRFRYLFLPEDDKSWSST